MNMNGYSFKERIMSFSPIKGIGEYKFFNKFSNKYCQVIKLRIDLGY